MVQTELLNLLVVLSIVLPLMQMLHKKRGSGYPLSALHQLVVGEVPKDCHDAAGDVASLCAILRKVSPTCSTA